MIYEKSAVEINEASRAAKISPLFRSIVFSHECRSSEFNIRTYEDIEEARS